MAAKGQSVTLEIGGDASKLSKAFDQVGASSKQMADKVDSASRDMANAGSDAAGRLTEGFDATEQRSIGFRDSITGLQDGFKGLTDDSLGLGERLLLLGTGVGDLASGFVNLIIPALASFRTLLMTTVIPAVWSFTTALLANPMTWVVLGILALIAVIVLLVTKWDTVTAKVGQVIRWIRDRWNGLVDWFKSVPRRIGEAFGALGSIIGNVFKGAINVLIDALNWGVDRINNLIYGINVVSPFDDIGYVPHIPRLHTGGIVPGMVGSEQLAILQAGERVSAVGQSGGTTTLVVSGTGGVAELINYLIRTGDIQVVQA